MPQRRINFPEPIRFCDPMTGVPIDEAGAVLDFPNFIGRLLTNPLWNESWKPAIAQRSIISAFRDAISSGNRSMLISEEDWTFLAEAAMNLRTATMTPTGPVVQQGIGFVPQLSAQILPFQLAIIDAEKL